VGVVSFLSITSAVVNTDGPLDPSSNEVDHEDDDNIGDDDDSDDRLVAFNSAAAKYTSIEMPD